MRISDWSSDVCSSDLARRGTVARGRCGDAEIRVVVAGVDAAVFLARRGSGVAEVAGGRAQRTTGAAAVADQIDQRGLGGRTGADQCRGGVYQRDLAGATAHRDGADTVRLARTSVVEGKSGSVSVD